MNMLFEGKEKSRFVIGFFAGAILLFSLWLGVTKVLLKPKPAILLTEGFDFNLLRAPNLEWRGPDIGAKLDLTRLEDRNGKTLASSIDKRPAMFVSVNSGCAMCTIATDQMQQLRNELSKKDVNYYILFFLSQNPESDFKYADSLNLGAESFVWNAKAGPPPEAIFKMSTPSHLLINNGTIIRVWPGSYAEKSVRDRMARQILADTNVVIDTLNAVLPGEVSARK
jgi:hypothetical protein